MTQLADRTALVTGGARGIGAGIVQRLAADGAHVVFTYASGHGPAEELVARVRKAGGSAVAVQADSADRAQVARVVDDVVQERGGLDIVVSSAGGGALHSLAETDFDDIDRMIDVNVRGTVAVVKHALPHLKEGGRVVTVGSVTSHHAPDEISSVYALTKGAVASFVRGMARELGPRGITINNVQPGPVHTDANPEDGPAGEWLRSKIAIGRFGKVSEVASFVSYLVSDEASLVTGASLDIDGGYSL